MATPELQKYIKIPSLFKRVSHGAWRFEHTGSCKSLLNNKVFFIYFGALVCPLLSLHQAKNLTNCKAISKLIYTITLTKWVKNQLKY